MSKIAVTPSAGAPHEPPSRTNIAPVDVMDDAEFQGRPPRARRIVLPVILLLATCVSTWMVGATHWNALTAWEQGSQPSQTRAEYSGITPLRRLILRADWQTGFIYAACVMGILFAHEMGHFFFNHLYRVPGSLPYFIPFPLNPVGTMGAVIVMQANRANRRELFDIGIAGPIAGLVVCIPVLWMGISQLDLTQGEPLGIAVDLPLALRFALEWFHTPGYVPGAPVSLSQTNAYFVAGWFGLWMTGLNMMPVSQLDGGHVIFALFGKNARVIAHAFFFGALAASFYFQLPIYGLMFILIFLMGIEHPPTADDTASIGPVRTALGYASLVIPILTFAPRAILL
jgi:hypothetical protein